MNRSIMAFRLPKSEKSKNRLCLVAIFLFCVVVINLPILIAGFPYGSDQRQHLRFAISVREAVAEGSIVPNWTVDTANFGDVGIRFYPPLAYVTTAVFEKLVGNWYDAFTLNLLAWMFIGSLGVYSFCREWSEPYIALIGGLLSAIVPYHLTQIYQLFLYAEFAGFALVPFCFLCLTRAFRRGRWIDFAFLGITYSLLLLTHIPLALIATISLVVYGVAVLDWSKLRTIIPRIFGTGVFTFLATSFWLVNVLFESSWLAHNSDKFSTGYYSFSTWLFPNLLYKREMILLEMASWQFDTTILLTVLLSIPGAFYLLLNIKRRYEERNRILLALVLSSLFSFFMLSAASYALWDAFPLLQKVQFPWRWLSVLSFFATASFCIGIGYLFAEHRGLRRPFVYFGIVLIFAISIYDTTQSIVTAGGQSREEFARMLSEVRHEKDADYWWPVWAKRTAFENLEPITAGTRAATVQNWSREIREFSVDSGAATDVRIATFFYPYWRATVNGLNADVNPGVDGTILIPIPSESSRIQLVFEEPVVYRLAGWVSALAWFSLLGSLVLLKVNEWRSAAVFPPFAEPALQSN